MTGSAEATSLVGLELVGYVLKGTVIFSFDVEESIRRGSAIDHRHRG